MIGHAEISAAFSTDNPERVLRRCVDTDERPTVYVAASMKEVDRAHSVMNAMEMIGCKVAIRWMDLDGTRDPTYALELSAVRRSNCLLLLAGENMTPGKHVEMGAALALHIPVVVSGGSVEDCGFYYMADRTSLDTDAIFLAKQVATEHMLDQSVSDVVAVYNTDGL